jgi:uncharacterized protein YbcC (UPF0753/DUF2309 family)
MNTATHTAPASASSRRPPDPKAVRAAAEAAAARIAPTWPLDRFIAVNPFWSMIGAPVAEVGASLGASSGATLLMPRSWYRQARARGVLTEAHLEVALERLGPATTPERAAEGRAEGPRSRELEQVLDDLGHDEPPVPRRARVIDVWDAERDLEREQSWRELVTNDISQHCAAFFDDGQATLGLERSSGLYGSWRRRAQRGHAPALLMGLTGFDTLARALPATPDELLQVALQTLDVPDAELPRYLHDLLLDVNGWASWCAYRAWTARLDGGHDESILELLAVRLAWEWLLAKAGGAAMARRWQLAVARWPDIDLAARASRPRDWALQEAMELAWRAPVIRGLQAGARASGPEAPEVQAVFCIDVRSEVFRRALEAQSDAVQTLGFAGFFGLPIAYRPAGAPHARPQLPGLLAPRLSVADVDPAAGERRRARVALRGAWRDLKRGALSAFTYVDALGLAHVGDLVAKTLGRGADALDDADLTAEERARRRPGALETMEGRPLDDEARAELAAGMLRAMSLTRGFARLVLLAGHGSESHNNPHASGLDCGACCGQTGEINARVAASLLNDPAVRVRLGARGISVPDTTRFVAGLHNTTTDELRLFDVQALPASHHGDLLVLQGWLSAAGARARAERAGRLGLGDAPEATLHQRLRGRARDWGQVRPEWGLAGNAAFIVAPRERTRALDLQGRCFLHEYRYREDVDFAVLEQIMTAPMVVTHWINFQYYASTVDNLRYGSGNKVLHDVVGGHIGVFEGNGGDLRIGLPMQSLHDGERWMHEPLRLSVFIEAPRGAIEGVLARHPTVRDLVSNGWVWLLQLEPEDGAVHVYRRGGWIREG